MKIQSTMSRRTVIVAALALLGACATEPRLAEMAQPDGCAVAIQVNGAGAIALMSAETPDQIIFVRLSGDGLLGEELVRSNFSAGDRIYLLNAAPGTYAAVASTKSMPSPFAYGSPGTRTTYFPRDMVALTKVEVRKGELVFMGRFDVLLKSPISGDNEPDDLQSHYRQIITPSAGGKGLWQNFLQAAGGQYVTWGGLRASARDDAAQAAFARQAAEDLAGRGWDARIVRTAAATP
jgi:hypothetical protein